METSFLTNLWQRNRLMIKSVVIGILILILLVPTVFIQDLVREREGRQREVAQEVSSKWAAAQTLTGPYLIIPYKTQVTDNKGNVTYIEKPAYFLPDELNVDADIAPEIRYRTIFKIVVYKSQATFRGSFSINPEQAGINRESLLTDKAKMCFGISDLRGIQEKTSLNLNGAVYVFNAGLPANDVARNGIQTPVHLSLSDLEKPLNFSVNLKVKGSENLYFTPLGGSTSVTLSSSWSNPAFDGSFLPDVRQVNDKGFTAGWKILNLNRNYPQSWKDGNYNVEASAFGLNLLQPTDSYAKTMRSVKYAILFIALTFMLFFFIEIMQGKSIHPLQYVLIGLALCIFYTLLLSISEYINFNAAYIISTVATVSLITLYAAGIFKKWKIASVFGGVLTTLYAFIFVLIQLQDYALLFGSIGLFVLLALVMYYSRKIDWFNYSSTVKTTM